MQLRVGYSSSVTLLPSFLKLSVPITELVTGKIFDPVAPFVPYLLLLQSMSHKQVVQI